MKRFSNILFWGLLIFAGVALSVWGVVDTFGGLETIEQLGGGSLLIGFLKIPFCLWGGVQLLRAFYSIISKDMEHIANTFATDLAMRIAFVADVVLSALGIYFVIQYFIMR